MIRRTLLFSILLLSACGPSPEIIISESTKSFNKSIFEDNIIKDAQTYDKILNLVNRCSSEYDSFNEYYKVFNGLDIKNMEVIQNKMKPHIRDSLINYIKLINNEHVYLNVTPVGFKENKPRIKLILKNKVNSYCNVQHKLLKNFAPQKLDKIDKVEQVLSKDTLLLDNLRYAIEAVPEIPMF